MQSSVLHGAAERVRTLAVHRGAIWIWPGIALTYRCGTEVVPVSSEVIGFWITRLHGPEALYKEISSAVSSAACLLKAGDEIGAQGALDRLRLTVLSADGVALMRALSDELGIEALDLQVRAGPRTWNAREIALHCSLIKEHTEAARVLAKGGACPWDEEKHPRWPASSPRHQGVRFAPSVGSGGTSLSVAPPGAGHNGGPPLNDPPKVPEQQPPPDERYATVKAIGRWIAAALAAKANDRVDQFLLTLKLVSWMTSAPFRYLDQLKANVDEPKTFEELDKNQPGPGYHEHHIVEQTSAEQDGFPRSLIDSPDNRVIIPAMKHREITSWYGTKNPDYEDLSPREYLRGRNWNERYSLGIQKLIDVGVLKR